MSRRKSRQIARWFRFHGLPLPYRVFGFHAFDWAHPERIRVVRARKVSR